ncbi:MAG: TipAS antibiotic-recognition domain-containing protein [Actinomycetia bacterium]|nr:TipAS antibiotic-recognition domain-containing protein [Actinomycetes bacterium]
MLFFKEFGFGLEDIKRQMHDPLFDRREPLLLQHRMLADKAAQLESQQIGSRTAALMDAGLAADDPRATDLAERAGLQIDTWFYPCPHEMHVNLAEMYIADPRFTAPYEKIREGMARCWHDATLAAARGRERPAVP